MFKLRITYPVNADPGQIINILNKNYSVIKVSREYQDKGKDPHKRIYVDLIQK